MMSRKSELKGYQFLNGLQLQNYEKNILRTSKLNKDLSQIECSQCCLSVENSNSVFTSKSVKGYQPPPRPISNHPLGTWIPPPPPHFLRSPIPQLTGESVIPSFPY